MRFYPNAPWPTAAEISDSVKGDKTFLVLYRLLYFRHLLSKISGGVDRGTLLRHHVDAWAAFVDFFELMLDATRASELELPASWIFETLGQDLLYYFQQFHELRAAPDGGAVGALVIDDDGVADDDDDRFANTGSAPPDSRVSTAVAASATASPDDAALSSVWTLRAVLTFLHRIADAADAAGVSASPSGTRSLAAYFARLALTRLYVKLGDYATALACARPLGVLAGDGAYSRLAKAHVSLAYYTGFALMMVHRCAAEEAAFANH